MQQIINFLIRNKNNLIFLLLFGFSFYSTVTVHSFHWSRVSSSANLISGTVFNWQNQIETYFYLKEYNKRLLDENKKLRNVLTNLNDTITYASFLDSVSFGSTFHIRTAEVINNNFANVNNFLTINQGSNAHIKPEMGVFTSEGIVGIVDKVSDNYASVVSILNSKSKINAQLQNTNHFGSLVWNGNDPNVVQLIDVPRLAPVQKGDTIITGGKSFIFPKGIPIGTVEDFGIQGNDSYYTIDVRLFNDMTNIGYVYVIENRDLEEVLQLLNPEEEDE